MSLNDAESRWVQESLRGAQRLAAEDAAYSARLAELCGLKDNPAPRPVKKPVQQKSRAVGVCLCGCGRPINSRNKSGASFACARGQRMVREARGLKLLVAWWRKPMSERRGA